MTSGNAAPDKVFGDSFLLGDDLHLFCDDALLGICNYTHVLEVLVKTR